MLMIVGRLNDRYDWMNRLTILSVYEPTLLTIGLNRDPSVYWPCSGSTTLTLAGLGVAGAGSERDHLLPPRRPRALVMTRVSGTFLPLEIVTLPVPSPVAKVRHLPRHSLPLTATR